MHTKEPRHRDFFNNENMNKLVKMCEYIKLNKLIKTSNIHKKILFVI